MRSLVVIALIVFAYTCIPAAFAVDAANVKWSVDNGWLTASTGSEKLIKSGNGLAIDIAVSGAWLQSRSPKITANHLQNGTWEITYTCADGVLVDKYVPFRKLGVDTWQRSVTYTNKSNVSQDLTNVFLRVNPVVMPKGNIWRPVTLWMGEVSQEKFACVAYSSREDVYSMSARTDMIESSVNACWRLKPGQEAKIGSQWIWLGNGGYAEFRPEAQRWYKAIGIQTASNTPQWLPGAIYYKACAGGTIQSRSSDIGGYDNFAHQLDYLTDLGVTAVMYHSVHKHKTPPDPVKGGWNVYGILDYSEIDPISGGAEGFKRLTDATRLRGLHVMSELCLNGYYSSQAAKLKEWWTYLQDGRPVMSFGGASMDYACPQWQDEMRNAAHRLAQEFGVEGMRLDLGSGSGDNWGSPVSNHASYSFLGGSLEMLKAISEGATINERCPVLISEDGVHQPERLPITPTLYGFEQKQLITMGLPADLSDAARINKILRDFFECERGSLPDGAQVVRTINGLNEVVEWGRPPLRFGYGFSRALYGVMLSVPGIVQMVQEEETGSFEALRKMNWARRRVPELAKGEPDYLSVKFAPEVFSAVRSDNNSHALCLINLSGKQISGSVELPGYISAPIGTRVYDAVSGREASIIKGRFTWSLDPYETSILRIGNPPIGEIPDARFVGEQVSVPAEPAAFSVEAVSDGLKIHSGVTIAEVKGGSGEWKKISDTEYESKDGKLTLQRNGDAYDVTLSLNPGSDAPIVRIYNADKWYVSGRCALLEDRVMRRHYPFSKETGYHWERTMTWGSEPQGMLYKNVFPSGRMWQSVVEPLNPEVPAVAFEDKDGAGIVVSKIKSSAANIVLTDRSDEAFDGPYGLDLRFYNNDPDLSTRIPFFGIDGFWALNEYPKSTPGACEVSFRLSASKNNAREALAATRLPAVKRSSEISRQGDRFVFSEGGLYYAKPGKVTWAIPTTITGKYRLQMLLRHSCCQADGRDMIPGYKVSIDGVEQKLDWVKLHAWGPVLSPFATVLTPAVNLDGKPHTLTIETTLDWLAVHYPVVLVGEK